MAIDSFSISTGMDRRAAKRRKTTEWADMISDEGILEIPPLVAQDTGSTVVDPDSTIDEVEKLYGRELDNWPPEARAAVLSGWHDDLRSSNSVPVQGLAPPVNEVAKASRSEDGLWKQLEDGINAPRVPLPSYVTDYEQTKNELAKYIKDKRVVQQVWFEARFELQRKRIQWFEAIRDEHIAAVNKAVSELGKLTNRNQMLRRNIKKLENEIRFVQDSVHKIKALCDGLHKPSAQAGGMLNVIVSLNQDREVFCAERDWQQTEYDGACDEISEKEEDIGKNVMGAFHSEVYRHKENEVLRDHETRYNSWLQGPLPGQNTKDSSHKFQDVV